MIPGQTPAQRNLRFALRVAGLLAKGFGILFTLLFLAAAALYVALPRIVDGPRVKAVIEGQVQQVLRRPVRIDDLLLTPHGIKLTRFQVLEPDNQTVFMEGEYALVTIKLRALLDKRIELSNVRLSQPKIRVFRDAGGRWSFEDVFLSSGAGRAASARPFALPVSLAAEQTSIENGLIEVDDRLRGRKFTVEKLALSLTRFDVEAPFGFALSFDNVNMLGERKIASSLSLEGEANLAGLDWSQASVRVAKAAVRVDGHDVSGAFWLKGWPSTAFELEAALPDLSAQDLSLWASKPLSWNLPATKVKAAGTLADKRLRVDASAWGGPAVVKASATFDWSAGPLKAAAEAALESFPLDKAAAYKPGLERYELKGGASGEVAVAGTPGRWTFGKTHLRLAGAEAKFKHWRLARADADVTAYEDFARVALSLSNGSVRGFANEFKDLVLAVKLERKDLRVDNLSFRWDASKIRVRGRVVNLPDPRDVWISGTMDQLEWERAQQLVTDLVAAAYVSTRTARGAKAEAEDAKGLWVQTFKYFIPKSFPDTIGRIRIGKTVHKNFSFADMDLFWDVHGVTPQLDTVSGEMRVGLGPGRVNDIQAVSDSHKFLKIVFLPYIYMHKMNSLSVLSAATAYPKSIDFSRIEGQYGIRKGIVTTRFSDVDSPQLIAYADGTADFGREHVDMNILTRLTSYRAPLPEWWVDEQGRPAIGFRVRGDLNRPDLEPRLHKIAAGEIEKTISEGRRRAKERFEAMAKLEQLDAGPAVAVEKPKGAKP